MSGPYVASITSSIGFWSSVICTESFVLESTLQDTSAEPFTDTPLRVAVAVFDVAERSTGVAV